MDQNQVIAHIAGILMQHIEQRMQAQFRRLEQELMVRLSIASSAGGEAGGEAGGGGGGVVCQKQQLTDIEQEQKRQLHQQVEALVNMKTQMLLRKQNNDSEEYFDGLDTFHGMMDGLANLIAAQLMRTAAATVDVNAATSSSSNSQQVIQEKEKELHELLMAIVNAKTRMLSNMLTQQNIDDYQCSSSLFLSKQQQQEENQFAMQQQHDMANKVEADNDDVHQQIALNAGGGMPPQQVQSPTNKTTAVLSSTMPVVVQAVQLNTQAVPSVNQKQPMTVKAPPPNNGAPNQLPQNDERTMSAVMEQPSRHKEAVDWDNMDMGWTISGGDGVNEQKRDEGTPSSSSSCEMVSNLPPLHQPQVLSRNVCVIVPLTTPQRQLTYDEIHVLFKQQANRTSNRHEGHRYSIQISPFHHRLFHDQQARAAFKRHIHTQMIRARLSVEIAELANWFVETDEIHWTTKPIPIDSVGTAVTTTMDTAFNTRLLISAFELVTMVKLYMYLDRIAESLAFDGKCLSIEICQQMIEIDEPIENGVPQIAAVVESTVFGNASSVVPLAHHNHQKVVVRHQQDIQSTVVQQHGQNEPQTIRDKFELQSQRTRVRRPYKEYQYAIRIGPVHIRLVDNMAECNAFKEYIVQCLRDHCSNLWHGGVVDVDNLVETGPTHWVARKYGRPGPYLPDAAYDSCMYISGTNLNNMCEFTRLLFAYRLRRDLEFDGRHLSVIAIADVMFEI